MRVCLKISDTAANMYTIGTLKHLCRQHGVDLVEEHEADAIWVSVCDPDDLPVLQRARSVARGRPVIMGGFDSYCGVPYLAWADAVVVGEGFEFIEAWGRDPSQAMTLPCVLTRESTSVVPSYRIDWSNVPLVRLAGGRRVSYMTGRGCKGKCKFCLASWSRPHASVPAAMLSAAVKSAGRASFNCVSNDSDARTGKKTASASVRARDYLRSADRYDAAIVRFGIEGWTEDARRSMAKPITDDEIRRLFDVTAERRQRMELFFIVGYPGFHAHDIDAFAEYVLPVDPSGTPAVHIKVTYFDPCPHTPWKNEAVGCEYVDTRRVFAVMNSRNKRVRVFPTRSQARSAWRTVFHRCTPEQAVTLGPCPGDANHPGSLAQFRSYLNCKGLLSLLGPQDGNVNDVIHTSIHA